ncbi:hypothetical protein Q4489_06300 [Thalassotalea sp. 1_MG-2023]|uniref:hypothetical protein n=1 Tax=Thalassotalea sp. 1_MG-2023 TaxID=3062680 RepID=UPI0026E31802|nr:hypothetical protein [Thalassotalea sp. 1_MG-2023]MDO6426617.1 hypothetical protein [Thalassotalea sp. 1_MG-2023]
MRILAVLIIFISCLSCLNASEEKELPPLDSAYIGVHGMVLVSQGSRVFASHMPLYQKPHDFQILYKIETKQVSFLNLVRDAELVTIKPEPFNLQRLERGEELTVLADVYLGHYERGGSLVYEKHPIVFSKKLYARKLENLAESGLWKEYDSVTLRKGERIYIHKIQQAPSFDHLIFVDLSGACAQKFKTSTRVPTANELTYKFINCGTMKPLYYETKDFNN